MLLAIALIEFFLPSFNQLVGKQLDVEYTSNWLVLSGLLILTILVGIIAGSYPAFFLARIRPIQAMQSNRFLGEGGKKPFKMRSVLVVAQFMISIVLSSRIVNRNCRRFIDTISAQVTFPVRQRKRVIRKNVW